MKIPSEVRLTEMEKGAPAFPTAEHLTSRLGASILELLKNPCPFWEEFLNSGQCL